jgi:hypothetical protein
VAGGVALGLPLPLCVEVVLRDDPNKSTGVHAAVLCPRSVTVRAFPSGLVREEADES